VWPVEGTQPEVAPLASLASDPIALPDDVTPAPVDTARPAGGPALAIEGARAVDATSPSLIEIPVTLSNRGAEPVVVRFRPETLGFDVAGPTGVADCAWPVPAAAPTRIMYTSLPAGGSTSMTVVLGAYCNTHTFDAPGLLVVRPRLDTRRASGESIGVRAFEGLVIATKPTIVRLHTSAMRRPSRPPTLAP
jgi:hypothetical protein